MSEQTKGRETWTDATGKIWKVSDMSDEHVRNAFCFLLRRIDDLGLEVVNGCDATEIDIY